MEKIKTFIKICGIKRIQDAITCYNAGINAVGFVFFRNSPRFISFDDLKSMIKDMPPITKIGIFPEMDESIIKDKCMELCLSGIQVYHDLNQNLSDFLKIRGIFYPEKQFEMIGFDFLLFDFKKSGFDHAPEELALDIKKEFSSIPLIFAGNLNRKNIKGFVKKIRPFGVDISRGVEIEPGIKDKNLIFEIVEKIKEAENET